MAKKKAAASKNKVAKKASKSVEKAPPAHTGDTVEPRLLESVDELIDWLKSERQTLFAGDGRAKEVNVQFLRGHWDQVTRPQDTAARVAVAKATSTDSLARWDGPIQKMPVSLLASWKMLPEIADALADENSELRKLSTLPIQRTFVYLDVTEFSKYEPIVQLLVLNVLTSLSERADALCAEPHNRARYERRLPIGDGFIFAFHKPVDACQFAVMLAHLVHSHTARGEHPEIHFRIGVHGGQTYSFYDGLEWNYTGAAINDAQRVLAAIGKSQDDVVFLSGWTHSQLMNEKETDPHAACMLTECSNRGRRKDKHKNWHRLYELNHVAAYDNLKLARRRD